MTKTEFNIKPNRKIFSHLSKEFKKNRIPNGAVLYSKEILEYFIPNIVTDRNWVTVRRRPYCFDHSIVFIHNNLRPELYNFLSGYKDLILVCSQPSTMVKVKDYGLPIYLPLSVDVKYVERFRRDKTKEVCYAGRAGKPGANKIRGDRLENLSHNNLLKKMACYRQVYAVGRTAIEAKILGCEILPYDSRYPDPSIWKILDSKDATKILQERLDEVDN